jgi:hypothetical protein
MVAVTYDGSPHRQRLPPTLSALLKLLRWVALPFALWLLWDAVAYALMPRLIYAPF